MPLLAHSAPARCAMLVRQNWIIAAICQRCCAAVLRMSSAKTSASGAHLKLLENGDGIGFGKLMNESHESSRQNFENSTPELDLLVSIAQNLPGVLGARFTGAGFGGATVTLCERLCAKRIAAEISRP